MAIKACCKVSCVLTWMVLPLQHAHFAAHCAKQFVQNRVVDHAHHAFAVLIHALMEIATCGMP